MTNKEFYNFIISANLSDEVTEKAKTLLASVEKKQTKSAEKTSATKSANIGLAKSIASILNANTAYAVSEILTAIKSSELASEKEFEGITTSKISAVCKVGVESNLFTVIDGYKVGGKGRGVKGYTLIESENESED